MKNNLNDQVWDAIIDAQDKATKRLFGECDRVRQENEALKAYSLQASQNLVKLEMKCKDLESENAKLKELLRLA